MWDSFNTADYEGMVAEVITLEGHGGRPIRAYWSRPTSGGPHPGLVLIPHIPGWDEWCRETVRRFTAHGYSVLCPNIYEDYGHGTPEEVSRRALEAGMCPDSTVMGDTAASLGFLKNNPAGNGRVGVIGMCSGGRHAFLAACTVPGFDAAVDCWGGGVAVPPEAATPARPVAPVEYTKDLPCPLIGIFGNDDRSPDRAEVDALEAELKKYGKEYEFHRYDGAGHGIWYYHRPMYRQAAAMESFDLVLDFLDRNLKNGG